LVENVTAETIRQGNPSVVASASKISMEEFSEMTNWSDYKVAVPVLFNFYHGLELLLKGFILTRGEVRRGHKISELYGRFCELFPEVSVAELLKPHISEIDPTSVPGIFLSSNGISIDELYQALRYPTSTKGDNYSHGPLGHNEGDGLRYFQELNHCVTQLRHEAVALGRSLIPGNLEDRP
jgi:hypothetical protein